MSDALVISEAIELFARIVGVRIMRWSNVTSDHQFDWSRIVLVFEGWESGPSMEILLDVIAVKNAGGMDNYLREKIEEFVETADERH